MRKFIHYILALFLLVGTFSCDEENYKDMNITNPELEVYVPNLTGNLTAQIVATTLDGLALDTFDMGATFYLIDNTKGGATSREWTITKDGQTITSTDRLVRVMFPKPGDVTVTLKAVRASDGQMESSQKKLYIKSIPVQADFITDPIDENGVVKVYAGTSITFTSTSKGSPTIFSWTATGPVELTSNEENPTLTFVEPGTYDVSLTASRDDGAAGIVEDNILKEGLIEVMELNVDLIRAVATDNKIELQYTMPVAQTLPDDAASQYSIKINTAAGATLTPSVLGVVAKDEKTLEITFGDKMYSDDEVLVSFNPKGNIKDATGLVTLEAFADEPCVYGKALAWGDVEDQSKWVVSANTQANDGKMLFVDENAPEYAMKPYQGSTCIAIVRGSNSIGVSLLDGFDVKEGDVIELAYEALSVENVPGALERRMSLVAGDGSNAAGGNWMKASDNGKGTGEWMTVKKTINVSAGTKGKTGTLYLHFLRYGGGSDTACIWIDNVRIYVPDPRP